MQFTFTATALDNGAGFQTEVHAPYDAPHDDIVLAFLEHLSLVYGYDLRTEYAPKAYVEELARKLAAEMFIEAMVAGAESVLGDECCGECGLELIQKDDQEIDFFA